MIRAELTNPEIADLAQHLRDKGEPFAIATVIRTLGATAAKPGAKALLDADGTILQGWIGGGCVRGALARATKRAMAENAPQFISLHPQDLLDERGISPGDDVEGVRFARNGCPSKGSMDIFIELVTPMPELLVYGDAPVAQSLMGLGAHFQWAVLSGNPDCAPPPLSSGSNRMIVIATQGKNDLASLKAALAAECTFIAFVGSRRKFSALSEKLRQDGIAEADIARVQAPAGLAIGAVTPDEIALSIMAQLTAERRRHQRDAQPAPESGDPR